MTEVAILGAAGFVGAATATDLLLRGVQVRPVAAPRLTWPAACAYHTAALPATTHRDIVEELAGRLWATDAVVNAAGMPDGSAPATAGLYGANAMLPTLVSRACALAGVGRYVHVSSAAVQGGRPLDETSRTAPFSPYSCSKALGERLLLAEPATDRVVFRATWVHAADRPNTRAVARLARSAASSVAGDGSAPTPQVLIGDIAASIAHLALIPAPVPSIALQPHNGMTTGLLLQLLGGREPWHVPRSSARVAVRMAHAYGRLTLRTNAHARRAEMLLFGRTQVRGWLARQGLAPRLRPEAWQRLAGIDAAVEKV